MKKKNIYKRLLFFSRCGTINETLCTVRSERGIVLKEKRLRYRSPRITCPAYAKINLYLDALGRREDGYHELYSIMHALDLHDDIVVQLFPSDTPAVTLRIFGAHLPTDRRNLVFRAAEAYLARVNLTATASVVLRKKLPIAAGIGGGSSDAAATLLAMNRAAGGLLGKSELLSLAAELGSDVPFCLVGGTQICRGRGEKMEPLLPTRPLYAVLVTGREYVSTPRAFAAAMPSACRWRIFSRSFWATKERTCRTMSAISVPMRSLSRRVSRSGISKTRMSTFFSRVRMRHCS